MNYALHFDRATAIRVAELLEQDGDPKAAASAWWDLLVQDPYDRLPRERFAEIASNAQKIAERPADLERSRVILRVMGISFPTPRLTSAYFDNLQKLLASKPKRAQPGRLILGLGSGRCGSTTFTSAMAGVPEACATHENPPALFWDPLEEQLRFHIERFRILTEYFAVVFDGAHWWLNALERLGGQFPDLRVIGLCRETEACVESFLTQKGTGKNSANHWAVPGNGIWATGPGDPSYPSYAVPAALASDPDGAKRAMLTRYVAEYNQALERAAKAHPERVLIVRTEDLRGEAAYARMSDFLGFEVRMPTTALNVEGTVDSHAVEWMY